MVLRLLSRLFYQHSCRIIGNIPFDDPVIQIYETRFLFLIKSRLFVFDCLFVSTIAGEIQMRGLSLKLIIPGKRE